jgi:hypothetical protein
VIPLAKLGGFFPKYTCETIITENGAKKIEAHELVSRGENSFELRLGKLGLWFTVRPVRKEDRRLPFVGEVGHSDFALPLMEIEPEEPRILDRLHDEESTFVIGCEPFTHYSGIRKLAKHR